MIRRLAERLGAVLVGAALLGIPALLAHLLRKEPPPPGPKRDAELDRHGQKTMFDTILETAAGSIDRAKNAAQFVQGAAAAVATLYTGALGLVFVAGDNPLPARGLVPTLFLAGSVALATFYIAFISRGASVPSPRYHPNNDSETRMAIQIQKFLQWTGTQIHARRSFLRGAVVSLAVGVLLLPLPFVTVRAEYVAWLPGDLPEPPAATTAPVLELPPPQFIEPVALAEIAYQARIEEFLEARAGEGPQAPQAADVLALWATVAGIVAVAATMLVTWGQDALLRRRLRPRRR